MKPSSAELKIRAKKTLLGNYGTAVGTLLILYGFLIAWTILICLTQVFSIGLRVTSQSAVIRMCISTCLLGVSSLFQSMLLPGLYRLYLNMIQDGHGGVGDIFFAFKNHAGKFFGIAAILALFTILTSLPNTVLMAVSTKTGDYGFYQVFSGWYFVVMMAVSLYLYLNFSLFFYILAENPEKGLIEALMESKELLTGNRGRYIFLSLSFLGWFLFIYLTTGIGLLWLLPYIICTNIHFYLDLKPQVEEIPPQWQTDPEFYQEPEAWKDAEVWQE